MDIIGLTVALIGTVMLLTTIHLGETQYHLSSALDLGKFVAGIGIALLLMVLGIRRLVRSIKKTR